MPIYEYRCGECGFEKEFLQRMSDAPLTDCPKCGKPALKKLVSAAGFQLKGTGWYVTDFRDKGGDKGGKGGDKSAKPDAANKKEGAAETAKPAEGAAKETSKTEAPAASAPAKSTTEKA